MILAISNSQHLWLDGCFWLLLLLQIPATFILLSRLFPGIRRPHPPAPQPPTPDLIGTVTVIIPTLNEAARISPCLAGVTRQSYEVREIIIVDSHSQDETPNLVQQAAHRDPRIRLIQDDPLPTGWVGRPWALHTGFLASNPETDWILGLDADTVPAPQLAASLVKTAQSENYDLISLSSRFILEYPGEIWLQPALLMTLIYRFGPPAINTIPERVMANGQCFLSRRSLLQTLGGYKLAQGSFCDDVTLARIAAKQGFKVGFLDGCQLLQVRMYQGARETWQEWGRSLDLKDASSSAQLWGDLGFLFLVQGVPGFVILYLSLFHHQTVITATLWGLNLGLLLIRFALSFAIHNSYNLSHSQGKWLFWLSPLADPLAVLRLLISAINRPTQWRGRNYSP